MALQTGPDGNILIDSSFATAARKHSGGHRRPQQVTARRAHQHPLALSTTPMATRPPRRRLHHLRPSKHPQPALHAPDHEDLSHHLPAAPAGALPTVTFDHAMHLWHNGDSLDLVHFDPAHTDTDIYIHFHKADVLHLGDIWFNGMYPFIDEGTGGSIGGMIRAGEKALAVAGNNTKIIPGHGPLGSKSDLKVSRHAVICARQGSRNQEAGATEQETLAKKTNRGLDAAWGKGFMGPRRLHRPRLSHSSSLSLPSEEA